MPGRVIGGGGWVGGRSSAVNRSQILHTAQGVLAEPGPAVAYATAASPSTQVVYGSSVGLAVGDTVTGVFTRIHTAAAGTTPTLARFGLADSTGLMLAVSDDVKATTNWAAGVNLIPFSSTYSVPTEGGYFVVVVVNGTWGTTQPQFARAAGNGTANALKRRGSGYIAPGFAWTGQTDLPAVGASLTITASPEAHFYMAVY